MARRARGEPGRSAAAETLTAAAWAEADRALAFAWRDAEAAAAALAALGRARAPARRAALLAAAEAAQMLARQALAEAARLRRLELAGAMGAIAPFDPALHDSPAASGFVRIVAPAVVRRGPGRRAEVLALAVTRAARANKGRS